MKSAMSTSYQSWPAYRAYRVALRRLGKVGEVVVTVVGSLLIAAAAGGAIVGLLLFPFSLAFNWTPPVWITLPTWGIVAAFLASVFLDEELPGASERRERRLRRQAERDEDEGR